MDMAKVEGIQEILASTTVLLHPEEYAIASIPIEDESRAREILRDLKPFSSITYDYDEVSLVIKINEWEKIKTGFRNAHADIVVTLDADGEHNPGEIPLLITPLLSGKADLVLGKRKSIPRISERLISFLTRLKTGMSDSGTGFRALKKELALKLSLNGRCICGISVLEAYQLGARITEVPITLDSVEKRRK